MARRPADRDRRHPGPGAVDGLPVHPGRLCHGLHVCASGQQGLQRNLSAGEIVEQVLHLQTACGHPITHVVVMGMGEPLANYEATVAAIRTIIDPQRLGISARRVTVSTVGLPAQIRRLAEEDIPLTLAIRLHAPTDGCAAG